jgi:pre-rRNA-processing protein TSR3
MTTSSTTRPTIIVVHPKENRKKCSVEPLRKNPDFLFWKYPHAEPEQLTDCIRLGVDGPSLSTADRKYRLVVLDGTWRWAEKMEESYAEIPARRIDGWETAYPRISKVFDDPLGGLATIEAIYAAFLILGIDTTGLLDQYHWKDRFLELNQALIAQYSKTT